MTVYQHLEKEGMVAEVLSAKSSDALYDYLKNNGLEVEKDSISIFADYIGKDFSFVASWIAPAKSGDPELVGPPYGIINTEILTKGILMTFPTSTMFYPLKPGSVYPGEGLPETISVIGYVSPELYESIEDTTDVRYFYSENGAKTDGFFSTDDGFGFTKIVLNAAPKDANQDLSLSPDTPFRVLYADFVSRHYIVYGALVLVILSAIATNLALYFLKIPALTARKRLLLSLCGCFTLLGTILGSWRLLSEKRIKFVVMFSVLFILPPLAVLRLLDL